MAGFSGPAIVSADLKLAIDPADDVCNGGKSVMSDLVGSYDGTLQSGNGLYFDGSNDYVVFPGTGSVDNEISTTIKGSTKYSISLWIYNKDVTAYKSIWGVYNTHELHTYNNGQLWWWHNGGQTIKKTSGIANDTWYHVVCTWNGSTRYLYVDGALGASASDSQATLTNGTNMVIGDQGLAGRYWNGQISDFRLYNCYLDATQVKHLYENPNAVLPAGVSNSELVGWWPIVEGSGTTANDYSGNDNHGTLTNSPKWISGSATVPQTATGFEHTASLAPSSNEGWLDFGTTNNRGSGSYMTITRNSTTIFELDHANYGNGFTWEQWINFSDESIGDGRQQIWDYGTNGDNRIAFSKIGGAQSGTYQFYYRESSSVIGHFNSAAHDPTPGVWYHIVFVKRGTAGEFYLDGNALSVTTTNTFTSTGDINGTFYVGRAVQASESGYDFTGKITGINFYDRSLSHGQILKNYNAKKSRFGK